MVRSQPLPVAQGVYLLLIGGSADNRGRSSFPNLAGCLCLRSHGNWYRLRHERGSLGGTAARTAGGRESAASPRGSPLSPDNSQPGLPAADATYSSSRQLRNLLGLLFVDRFKKKPIWSITTANFVSLKYKYTCSCSFCQTIKMEIIWFGCSRNQHHLKENDSNKHSYK